MNGKVFRLSGLNGATGAPLLPAMTPKQVAEWITAADKQEETTAKERLRSLGELRIDAREKGVLGTLVPGYDPLDPEQAGWGIVYAPSTPPEVRETLADLVAHRKGKVFETLPGESSSKFQSRHKQSSFSPLDPQKLPYYLLLVGPPDEISFRFQYGLDVLHAVGRLWFEDPGGYARYVASLLEHEGGAPPARERRVAFFAPRHPGDEPTANSSAQLVSPLAEALGGKPLSAPGGAKYSYFSESVAGDAAVQPALLDLLTRGDHRPALVFAAAHGVAFPKGHARQRSDQGALVCREWPGPDHWPLGQEIPGDMLCGAGQIPPDADLGGRIVFTFACYGAGTPRVDDFSHLKKQAPEELAPAPFVSRLPQRLLAQGALAFLGHVDRAWDYSFLTLAGDRDVGTFQSALESILGGVPLGHAFDYFNDRYLALARQVTEGEEGSLLHNLQVGEPVDLAELAHLWMAHNDARAYVLFGDPAARLRPDALTPV